MSNHEDKGELPVLTSFANLDNRKRVFCIKIKIRKSNNNDWKVYQIEDSRGFRHHSHPFSQFTLFDILVCSSVCRGFNLRF
jgi:hypothetical protein